MSVLEQQIEALQARIAARQTEYLKLIKTPAASRPPGSARDLKIMSAQIESWKHDVATASKWLAICGKR